MATSDNLQDAFAGESQANRKYLAFAKKAADEGFTQVAKLFRAVGEAETIHAHAHLRVMGGVGDTATNLQAAIDGEGHEFKEMYPGFLTEAENENNQPAAFSFKNAMAAEEVHHGEYTEALAAVNSGQDLPEGKIYICSVCGNTAHGEQPDQCSICGVPGSKFFEVV
ncbi:rubrerythrin family protein [Candidatus Zixiibacteriota bacterium]